jgi:hypothetical protein
MEVFVAKFKQSYALWTSFTGGSLVKLPVAQAPLSNVQFSYILQDLSKVELVDLFKMHCIVLSNLLAAQLTL